MTAVRFNLPDLGEGLTESEIVAWRVAEGDTVELNQIIAEVETAKAVVDLPSPYEGIIGKLFVEEGTVVAVGQPIVSFEVENAEADVTPDVPGDGEHSGGAAATTEAVPANLVGYGAKELTGAPRRRRRGAALDAGASSEAAPSATPNSAPTGPAVETTAGYRPRSTPPVRKFARDLGVSLEAVAGTGPDGRITRADIEKFRLDGGQASQSSGEAERGPRGSRAVTRIPIKGVRKFTAQAMVQSAFSAPQATIFKTVDVTETMRFVREIREQPRFADVKVTLLTLLSLAVCAAVERTPQVNASWRDAEEEIWQFEHVDLGIAAATPRGLTVPKIRSADALGLHGLASAITSLTSTARAGKTAPADLVDGTITITNVGVFGVDAGSPILTPGEAAIVCIGATQRQPWEHEGAIALRDVVTLSVSIDHRVIDGAEGSRFLADIGKYLSNPAILLASRELGD